MAVKFAVRGDSLNARYSNGGKTPGQLRGTGSAAGVGVSVVNSAETGMIGSSYIDQYGGVNQRMGLIYPGGDNLWQGAPGSILMRCAKKVAGIDACLFSIGGPSSESHGFFKAFLGAGGASIYFAMNNDYNAEIVPQTDSTLTMTLNTYHDILLTWTGTTAANGVKIYKDGVLGTQLTATNASAGPETRIKSINIGYVMSIITTCLHTEEFVIWDQVINPASVALTSGTGSLNGASRTAFVDVAAFDGLAPRSAKPKILGVPFIY